MSSSPRNVTPIIAWIRNWFGMRPLVTMHRFEDYNIVKRNVPEPRMPAGIHDKLKDNCYHLRDGRGFAKPPVIAYASQKQIGTSKGQSTFPTPGTPFDWAKDSPLAK